MWTVENRPRYDRSKLRYPSDLTDEEWALARPEIPRAKRGGNKRTVDLREVDERPDVCAEHGLPVAGDPEGPTAPQHRQLLFLPLAARRHA